MTLHPSPPGDTIKDIIGERGISYFKLGKLLNIKEISVLKLLSGDFLIDDDMAYRLSDVLGSTPEFWKERERLYRKQKDNLKENHPTWKRKLRWIMVDNPVCKCPYCGDMTQYPDDVCDTCEREVLPCRRVFIDG